MIARNLAGEMGFLREAEHHELYLQFLAEGFDISHEQVLATLPTPGTAGAASAVGYYCRSSFLEGVGGFGLAVEMEVPGTAKAGKVLLDALGRHYRISRHALEFFEVHIEAEDEHGGNAVDVLRLCAQTVEQQAILRRAFRFSVLAHRGMREGYDRFLAE
jgi:pyrroloquinoline quinone (PQQ) biosynthesis protein C